MELLYKENIQEETTTVGNRSAKIRKMDTQPETHISCFYTNADTLTNKMSELKIALIHLMNHCGVK